LEELYSGTFYRIATSFPTLYKGHLRGNRRVPIKYRKEPHYKVLEAHAPADFMQR
jgi:hypothetical protein